MFNHPFVPVQPVQRFPAMTPPRYQLAAPAVLGQNTVAIVQDPRAEALTMLVGVGLLLGGTMGKGEPNLALIGAIMAGIGGAGFVSGVVKSIL